MPRPIHFEIYAQDPLRAAKFYEDVFDWKIEKWEGPMDYWMVMTGRTDTPGIDGGMMERTGDLALTSPNAYVLTMDVSNFDQYHEKIMAAGGTMEMEKHEIPAVGWHGYYRDTEGNMFGILEPSGQM